MKDLIVQLNIDQKITLSKTFFEYFKNNKKYDKSYEYLEKMNNFCYSLEKYDIIHDEVFFKRLGQNITYPKIEFPKADTTPIFICGMPRSGTTLCEQILSTHSNVHGAGELRFMMQLTNLQDIVHQMKRQLLTTLRVLVLVEICQISEANICVC